METVLITGANRGIGIELVKCHISRGDKVIAVCRDSSDALDESGAIIIRGIDMSNAESISSLRSEINAQSISRVIANAGFRGYEDYDTLDFDSIRYQYEVNALGPLRLVQNLDSCLTDGAKVVLISTKVASLKDNESGGEFGYRMSKAALNMAGVNLAHALKPRKIAVFLLHPGYVRTDLTGGDGLIDADESAAAIVAVTDRKSLEDTGCFWHAPWDEEIPW